VRAEQVKEDKMQLIITGKNMRVSERTEAFVRSKLGRLDRHLNDEGEARVELSEEKTKSANQRHIVQVTLYNNGTMIRAEERAADLKVAVDAVVDKLDKQIRRYKDKQVRKRRVAAGVVNAVEEAAAQGEIENEARVVKTKRFRTAPMSPEEAIEQMELLDHAFFLFLNTESGDLNVVYRRDDGDYGLLEPQLN
jgi:putative sigma-54 modulation protein